MCLKYVPTFKTEDGQNPFQSTQELGKLGTSKTPIWLKVFVRKKLKNVKSIFNKCSNN